VFISQNGMVQRTSVKGISQQGRPAQGVRLMNLREDDRVSAVALVMEDAADAEVADAEELEGVVPVDGAAVDGDGAAAVTPDTDSDPADEPDVAPEADDPDPDDAVDEAPEGE
jgi:DNA gyrase subunit A